MGPSEAPLVGFQLFHFYFQIVASICFICTSLCDSLHLKVRLAKIKERQSQSGIISQPVYDPAYCL